MAFTNLDKLIEEDEKKRQQNAESSSQSGGQAYSASKPSGKFQNLDSLLSEEKPKPQQVSQTQQSQPSRTEEKKSLFSSVGGVIKEGGSKVLDLGGKALRAGLDLWNAQSAKNEVNDFKMRQFLYRDNRIEVDPVTGRKTITSDAMKAYNAAQTPEERQAIIDADTQEIPLIKAMNSDTGRKVLSFIGNNTSNVPLKAIASLKAIGDDTYDEAYAALINQRNNPENGAFKQFLYELQDSGVQSAIGVLLSLGATYASRSPAAGRTVGMSYYTGISGNAQQQERGEVNSLGNIAIDVVGDQLLGTSLESVFKGGSGVIRTALKSAGIEGTTEVGQSFLKYGNDYANARTQAEKDKVIAEAKKYVVEGGMLMEFAVGGVAGGIIGATAEVVSPSMTIETKGSAPKNTQKEEAPAPEENTPNFYSNTRDLLGEYEAALAAGETVSNDAEFSNVAELRNQLTEYQTLNKDKTLFLPEQASIEVVQYEDGNFAMRFSAKAGSLSLTAPFSNTQLFESKQAATEAGMEEIVSWVREQRAKTEDVAVRTELSALQDNLSDIQSQETEAGFSQVLDTIREENLRESGEYEGALTEQQAQLDIAIRDELFENSATIEQLVERFSTGAVRFTQEDIEARVAQLQNPEGSQKALESEIAEIYADAGFSEEGNLIADETLFQIALQMELSEAGYKVFVPAEVGGGSDVKGVSSTFPKWIPENLRSSALFDKVMGGLEIKSLSFPTGNRSRQRDLYNVILTELDAQLGVDTSTQREQILSLYENNSTKNDEQGQAAKSDSGSTKGRKQPTRKRSTGGGNVDGRFAADQKPQGVDRTGAEIKQEARESFEARLKEAGVEDFRIVDIEVFGSRARGTAREDSDLDIAFQYEGDIEPERVSDILRDVDWETGESITGGGEIGVANMYTDYSPTKEPLDEFLSRSNELDTETETQGNTMRAQVYGAVEEKMKKNATRERVRRETAAPRDTSKQDAFMFQPEKLAKVDSPQGRKEVEKIIKRSEIAAELSKKLAVPIRRGKYRGKALGIYKRKEQLIRYKEGGLPTIFHEAGHYIDLGLDTNFNKFFAEKANVAERDALGTEYGGFTELPKNKKETEVFAEFLRYYMTEPEKAKSKAPKFLAHFEEKMRGLPEVMEVIDRAKTDFARWNEMPSTQKVLSQVSLNPDNETISEKFSNTIGNLYRQGVDDLNPLFEFSKIAEDRMGDIPAAENPYILARNFRGWIGKANAFLETGTFSKKFWKENDQGKMVPDFKGKGLRQILKPIEDVGAIEDFTVFLISKRSVELAGRKITTGIDAVDAKNALEELSKKHPDFEQAAVDLYKYQDDLLVYGHENGLYDKKALETIRELNQSYVPFFRVMEELELGGGMGKGFGNVRSGIKRIKGSDRDIINPLESIVKNTYAVINAAERNNVALAMVSLSSKDTVLGQLVEEVATPMTKAATVGEEEIISAVKAKLLKERGLFGDTSLSAETEEELAGILVNVFRPAMITKDNTITVLHDGKRKFYEVDKDLYTAIQGLELEQMAMIMKVLSYPARWLRAGATLTPEFVLRNPMRDQWSAFAYSKNNYIPFVDLMRGMFSLFRKDSDYWLWRMGGGEHSMLVSMDRTELKKQYEDVVSSRDLTTKSGIKTVLLDLRNPLRVTQILSEFTEKGTRLGEAKAALRRSQDPIKAAYAAREVTLDFARSGEKTRAFNAITAFFNVQVQDIDKMFRSFKNHPTRTLSKVALGITLPSILLYLVNRDEEGWDEIPQWQKDLAWLIKVNDTWYRIPKPFGLGTLFGSAPERALEYMDRRDPQLMKDLQTSIYQGFTPSVIPTAALPIMENITNYSFFYQRAIVPRNKETLPAEAQYNNFTSETAKEIGDIIKYPPAKIDNLINGYFAGIGNYAVDIMDGILKGTGIVNSVTAPAKQAAELPILKAFMIRDPEGSGSNSVERFYLEWERANEASSYIKQLQKDGEDEKAYQFLAEHPEAELSKYYNQVQQQISAMNKARNEVYAAETLSADEKRKMIDEIDKQMTIVARNTIEMTLNLND